MKICTAWINGGDDRTTRSQSMMLRSVLHLELDPVIFEGTPRPLLSEMLKATRSMSPSDGAFMWVNSDCCFGLHWTQFVFRSFADMGKVVGIKRVESDGSGVCGGVDAYYFPCRLWDEIYAKDVPEMYVGGTHVDWWLTRAAQAAGKYFEVIGLAHESHPRSDASKGNDFHGQANLRNFNAWAERNGIPKC